MPNDALLKPLLSQLGREPCVYVRAHQNPEFQALKWWHSLLWVRPRHGGLLEGFTPVCVMNPISLGCHWDALCGFFAVVLGNQEAMVPQSLERRLLSRLLLAEETSSLIIYTVARVCVRL